jgi:hypothetical protein
MKIPYMKEIMFTCIGLNIAYFFLSTIMDNENGMWLATASGAMCALGLIANAKASKDK